MKWTSEKPKEPGWYWWRNDSEGGSSVEIIQVHMMVWNERDGEARSWCSYGWLHQLSGQWQGPIAPEEPIKDYGIYSKETERELSEDYEP